MDSRQLLPHPATPPAPRWRVEAAAQLVAGGAALQFRVSGECGRLRLPVAHGRCNGLWQHSCFEAFLQPQGGHGYLEFNFAPASAWAAYCFDGPRAGMRPLELPQAPRIAMNAGDTQLEFSVQLALPPGLQPVRAGLAAVLEDDSGALSYWALAHSGATPDFHDPSGFTLLLDNP